MLRPVLAASIATALVVLAGCQRDRAPADAPRPPPTVPTPVETRALGRLLEHAADDDRVIGFDGVSSIPVGPGALWLLNSFSRHRLQEGGFESASFQDHAALYTTAGDWAAKGRTRAWHPPLGYGLLVPLPENSGGKVVRLLGGIADGPATQTLFYAVGRPRDGRVAEVLGIGVARRGKETGYELERRHVDGDWRFFGRGDPLFGMAVLQADMGVTPGFDYVFGVRGDAATHGVYVARVPHGKTAERSAYRFLADAERSFYPLPAQRGWAADVKEAAPLFAGAEGGLSVTWNPHLEAFLAVYSRTEKGRLRVLARVAHRPEGPWGLEAALLDVPARAVGDVVRGAREHGHLAQGNGRVIYVSVPVLGSPGPALYRVQFP